jgi:hypothetical protein
MKKRIALKYSGLIPAYDSSNNLLNDKYYLEFGKAKGNFTMRAGNKNEDNSPLYEKEFSTNDLNMSCKILMKLSNNDIDKLLSYHNEILQTNKICFKTGDKNYAKINFKFTLINHDEEFEYILPKSNNNEWPANAYGETNKKPEINIKPPIKEVKPTFNPKGNNMNFNPKPIEKGGNNFFNELKNKMNKRKSAPDVLNLQFDKKISGENISIEEAQKEIQIVRKRKPTLHNFNLGFKEKIEENQEIQGIEGKNQEKEVKSNTENVSNKMLEKEKGGENKVENTFEKKENGVNEEKEQPKEEAPATDELTKKIEQMRAEFSLSKNDYSDEKLINILLDNNMNMYEAFNKLFG